jgi:hypothetical protein
MDVEIAIKAAQADAGTRLARAVKVRNEAEVEEKAAQADFDKLSNALNALNGIPANTAEQVSGEVIPDLAPPDLSHPGPLKSVPAATWYSEWPDLKCAGCGAIGSYEKVQRQKGNKTFELAQCRECKNEKFFG